MQPTSETPAADCEGVGQPKASVAEALGQENGTI